MNGEWETEFSKIRDLVYGELSLRIDMQFHRPGARTDRCRRRRRDRARPISNRLDEWRLAWVDEIR
jgi:hypothetical protein